MECVPREVFAYIFQFLTAHEVALNATNVSSTWRESALANDMWEPLFVRDHGIDKAEFISKLLQAGPEEDHERFRNKRKPSKMTYRHALRIALLGERLQNVTSATTSAAPAHTVLGRLLRAGSPRRGMEVAALEDAAGDAPHNHLWYQIYCAACLAASQPDLFPLPGNEERTTLLIQSIRTAHRKTFELGDLRANRVILTRGEVAQVVGKKRVDYLSHCSEDRQQAPSGDAAFDAVLVSLLRLSVATAKKRLGGTVWPVLIAAALVVLFELFSIVIYAARHSNDEVFDRQSLFARPWTTSLPAKIFSTVTLSPMYVVAGLFLVYMGMEFVTNIALRQWVAGLQFLWDWFHGDNSNTDASSSAQEVGFTPTFTFTGSDWYGSLFETPPDIAACGSPAFLVTLLLVVLVSFYHDRCLHRSPFWWVPHVKKPWRDVVSTVLLDVLWRLLASGAVLFLAQGSHLGVWLSERTLIFAPHIVLPMILLNKKSGEKFERKHAITFGASLCVAAAVYFAPFAHFAQTVATVSLFPASLLQLHVGGAEGDAFFVMSYLVAALLAALARAACFGGTSDGWEWDSRCHALVHAPLSTILRARRRANRRLWKTHQLIEKGVATHSYVLGAPKRATTPKAENEYLAEAGRILERTALRGPQVMEAVSVEMDAALDGERQRTTMNRKKRTAAMCVRFALEVVVSFGGVVVLMETGRVWNAVGFSIAAGQVLCMARLLSAFLGTSLWV